jgi:hypothetical protein
LPTSRAVPQTGHAWLQRFVVAVVLTAAVALAVVVVPLFALKPVPHSAPPAVSVTASAATFSTVPRLPTAQRRELAAGLESFLSSLYQRAFSAAPTGAVASPAASPDPVAGIVQSFSLRALDALRAHPDVFVPPDGVRVYDGRVSFSGVAAIDPARQTQAFLDVSFLGKAQLRGAPVEVVQKGSMLVVHTAGGWQVAGFDLTTNVESIHPTASSRAMPAAS